MVKKEAIREEAEKLLRAACDFQASGLAARQSCRDAYLGGEDSRENILRIMIDGQLAILAYTLTKKTDSTNSKISYQIGLSTSFVRTHFIISDLIQVGDLIESLVLIRKQIELLGRLHEIDSKPLQRLLGKVPNIQNIMKGATGKLYGVLSEVAHFSTPRVAELLHVVEDGDLIGPSLLPSYSERSRACFDMNCFGAVYFISWLIEKLPDWYGGYDNSVAKDLLDRTLLVALDLGVVRLPEKFID